MKLPSVLKVPYAMSEITFRTKAVWKVLQSLDINKASGPDMIPAVVVEKCAPETALTALAPSRKTGSIMSNRPISAVELDRRRLATAASLLKDLEAITAWGVSFRENMIWHEHVSSIATVAGKKLGYLFRTRKYFSPSNLLTLYKAQIRRSLEYCSHIWGATAPTTLSILDAVHKRAI
nr:unnamed protein product [Callosobruchus chinensis]